MHPLVLTTDRKWLHYNKDTLKVGFVSSLTSRFWFRDSRWVRSYRFWITVNYNWWCNKSLFFSSTHKVMRLTRLCSYLLKHQHCSIFFCITQMTPHRPNFPFLSTGHGISTKPSNSVHSDRVALLLSHDTTHWLSQYAEQHFTTVICWAAAMPKNPDLRWHWVQ